MESLEKFIEARADQSKFMAMMIPRWINTPNAFVGKKQFTLEQAEQFTNEAKKCRAVLKFLAEYNRLIRAENRAKPLKILW